MKDIWIADIAKYGGCGVVFPINADAALQVATAFDLLPAGVYLPDGRSAADSATARSRSSSAGPQTETVHDLPDVGRPQFRRDPAHTGCLAEHGPNDVVTPANRVPCSDVIIPPALRNDAASEKFGSFETVFPYLRKTRP